MADKTTRQKIVEALDTRFKGILLSNGYATNLGRSVHAWRTHDFEEKELPAITYRDTENTQAPYTQLQYTNQLTVEMEITPSPGAATITDARTLLADVFKAIAADDRWGGLAEDTQPAGDRIETEHHERLISRITVSIRIEYTSSKWSF